MSERALEELRRDLALNSLVQLGSMQRALRTLQGAPPPPAVPASNFLAQTDRRLQQIGLDTKRWNQAKIDCNVRIDAFIRKKMLSRGGWQQRARAFADPLIYSAPYMAVSSLVAFMAYRYTSLHTVRLPLLPFIVLGCCTVAYSLSKYNSLLRRRNFGAGSRL